MPATPLKAFIIYASQDRDLRIELERHLKLLEIEGSIKLWSDKEILPGDHWDATIKKQLASSDLFLMLVSVDFFNSEYIQQKEFKTALRRLESGDSLVIPIIIRPCFWIKYSVISELQVLPPEGKAVTDWPTHDAAWTVVVEQISERVEQLLAERAEAKRQQQEEKERIAHERAEAKRRQEEEKKRLLLEAEQIRLAEQARIAEEKRLAEAAALAEKERLAREREEARRRQQEEKERLAREAEQARLAELERQRQIEAAALAEKERLALEAEQARLAEQARIAEEKRLVEAAALAEKERLAREQAEKIAREEEVRRQAERKKQEEERARKYREAHDADWQKAEKQHTAESYRNFLSAYPTSIYAPEAKKRIKQLEPNRNRKYVWMASGLGSVLLLWLGMCHFTGSPEETRAPGCYLANTVIDGAPVTEDDLEFVSEKDKPYNGISLTSMSGCCFRSPDGSREIPKGTQITEEYFGRCAGIYAARNLRAGTLIEENVLDIEPMRPGSPKVELYDFNSQLRDMGLCIKCGVYMKKGEKFTRANIQRCGGVYLKKDLSPGTRLTDDMVEEAPKPSCAPEISTALYMKSSVVGMTLSRRKSSTFPAGKLLDINEDF